ncbi:MAG: hypothetical protein GF383_06535 [Candidatus Lokiarchaeota archaeon]|nr:hypothetical protein [Candidatus Lokiarchaeota archaeon]MBD3339712.1 hypothetical protein [Candidatus Lokiarchaeota archaeon]
MKLFGIPVVQAKSEGEAQAAYIVEKGEAWAIKSNDYDTLLFGGKRLIYNFNPTKRNSFNPNTKISYISLIKILEELDITREQLVEMSILIGNDYCSGIKGIGQKTALKLIKKYNSLSNLLREELEIRGKKIEINKSLIEQVKDLFLRPNVSEKYAELIWSKAKYKKIETFMKDRDFSENRIKTP